jgi:hypothetical protein
MRKRRFHEARFAEAIDVQGNPVHAGRNNAAIAVQPVPYGYMISS